MGMKVFLNYITFAAENQGKCKGIFDLRGSCLMKQREGVLYSPLELASLIMYNIINTRKHQRLRRCLYGDISESGKCGISKNA